MIKTVLIVDDSESILDILEKEIYAKLDVRILRATNFKDALKHILKEKVIHIAVLDLNLPDAPNGEIVDYSIKKGIPSVVLTSTLNQNLKNTILTKDIVDYILKNSLLSIQHAVSTIDRTLKNYDTHILVVEDSTVQRKLVVSQLEKIKLNVDTATNGIEALELFDKNKDKYSLVLTDYNMPLMDGLELTLNLRAKYEKHRLAIIVFSANSSPDVATNFLKFGANDFINKPYKEVEFKTRINSNLELIDMFRSIREQDKQIFDSSKNKHMSEMISNIAHHWRQPLNEISLCASTVSMNNELGLFDEKEVLDSMDIIVNRTKYLSETIDKFANFVGEAKEAKDIVIQDNIDDVLQILSATFDSNNIDIVNNIDYDRKVSLNLVEKDFTHVLITLLENAVDVLSHKDMKEKWIKIGLEVLSTKVIITVEDNAGGIPDDIMPKIFDPYFTTKHQSEDTGIDLHLSYDIIVNDLDGKLYVQNSEYGAKFFAELPL